MAKIVILAEIQAARRVASERGPEHENLERALQVMRENLAVVAAELVHAPASEHEELLIRVEQLTSMIRYGMRMLSYFPVPGVEGPSKLRAPV